MLEPGGDSSQFLLYVIVITVGLMILLAITLIAVVIMAFLHWRSRGKILLLKFWIFLNLSLKIFIQRSVIQCYYTVISHRLF